MLAASSGSVAGDGPEGRRIGIDRPYESPKVLLLDVVATANRCRSIWSKEFGFVTLVGYESDIEASETIFTSLLVQANHAMQAHGTRTTSFGRSRTRAFRQSFLMSYAHRIGERLREVIDDEIEAAVGRAAQSRQDRGGDWSGSSAPVRRRLTKRWRPCFLTWSSVRSAPRAMSRGGRPAGRPPTLPPSSTPGMC